MSLSISYIQNQGYGLYNYSRSNTNNTFISFSASNRIQANENYKKQNISQASKKTNYQQSQNINSLKDVAKSVGVSESFIKSLKKLEDGNIPENKYHNSIYTDKAGVKTIGIGHKYQQGEKIYLTDKEVLELCAKDLKKVTANLKNLIGTDNYAKLPTGLKEALIDMSFNKGTGIIKNDANLMYCLKNGKVEAAINCLTYNKSIATGKEMSGLSKRRLFDLSLAFKSYNGKIPNSNLNTAQRVYNRGIELLRQECKTKNLNFKNQLAGYNKDVKNYLADKIKYIEI